MDNETQTATQPPPSTFITVLAWIFIVLSGFSILMAIFQNIMFSFLFNNTGFQNSPDVPPDVFPTIFRVIMIGMVIFFAIELWASIALLKRKNWARIYFIATMILALLYSAFSIFWVVFFPTLLGPEEMGHGANFDGFLTAMRIGMSIFALAFAVLWGWVLKRLMSPEIRREFSANAAS